MNGKFVQITGPFSANEDIVSLIKNNYDSGIRYLERCGIQTYQRGHLLKINDHEFMIGKTGTLEFNNVEITSLKFLQDERESVRIDCVCR